MTSAVFPWKLVVFDCDGTLVDSQHSIVATMAAAFESDGRPAPSAEAVRRVVGLSLEHAVARLLLPERGDAAGVDATGGEATGGDADALRLADLYRHHFHHVRAEPKHNDPLFPGAREAVEGLAAQAVALGVATGKGRRGIVAVLERHGLLHHFVTLQTADVAPSKPHPGMLHRAMEEAGVEPADTVLVGDTTYDMEMAANAQVAGLGVSWGYHPPHELSAAGALQIVDSFSDLIPALGALRKETQ